MMQALVVDDSRTMRRIVGKIVRDSGFDPLEAADGAEALARLRQGGTAIAVALVDWNMPIMDGLALVRAVRADASLARIPIIMITSEGSGEYLARALEAGADEYLMKPFTRESLADKLVILGFELGS